MSRKKNKKYSQSVLSINTTNPVSDESQFTTIVTTTELQKLVQQGIKKQNKNSREKAYHKLIREVFNTKTFYNVSKQNGLISQANYYKNKIKDRVFEFLSHVGENKKEWLTREMVRTLHQDSIEFDRIFTKVYTNEIQSDLIKQSLLEESWRCLITSILARKIILGSRNWYFGEKS
ncbi:hypothetical protein Glove_122g4 [Diversispora epigaea]|uniref:Uncharacterized protein n=1 Tax=Diversispora epigaea TaxID=1348612 RepID=A0A397J910_9GLOM|nr:hypothetical protein Glove_122g4 [Diversispora epigaea]